MKEMGGTEQFNELFKNLTKSMGAMGKGARMDTNAMERMTKQQTTRERMLRKLEQRKQLQNQMKRGGFESTALGKYQIIQSTLLGTMGKAGVALTDKFDQVTQDKLGMALLKGRGLDQYLAKKMSPEKFADQLAMEWASMPYHTGASYYDKVGSNKSLVGRQAFVEALPKAALGGIIDPTPGGTPVLVGEAGRREAIIPLPNSDSILSKILTGSSSEVAAMMPNTGSSGVSTEMIEAMINKFDTMINYLSEGVDIQQKILRQS
jgi:hypothetical protein